MNGPDFPRFFLGKNVVFFDQPRCPGLPEQRGRLSHAAVLQRGEMVTPASPVLGDVAGMNIRAMGLPIFYFIYIYILLYIYSIIYTYIHIFIFIYIQYMSIYGDGNINP